ncbi:ABC transporter permease subunit [Arthrobacter yangruifuii]|uniref:ABC transporter permease subunit n=1 Tax=Arthrobacter yangruifuii TaxID=2606616 RepID=A0A5N6MDV0_9MICC|nr:ABC transporter permease [Arthrobacter yangruifuii]KAD3455942.1 ABC transporter permease subunit [Arthrobacter yangruifuii]
MSSTIRNVSSPLAPAGRETVRQRFLSNGGPFIVLVVTLLLVWEVSVWMLRVPEYILPAPTKIAVSLVSGFSNGTFIPHTWTTLQEVLLGFAGAILAALIVAAGVTRWTWAEKSVLPLVVALQTVPKVALAPLLLTWFGFGMTSKIVTTALLAFFPLLINVITGLQSADKDRVEMFKAMGASEWQIFTMLRLPNALPYFFAGLKIAVTFSIIGAIVAEFVGAQSGLGYLIQASSTSLDVSTTFAVLVILSTIGMIMSTAVSWLSTKVVFWQGKGLDAISGQ